MLSGRASCTPRPDDRRNPSSSVSALKPYRPASCRARTPLRRRPHPTATSTFGHQREIRLRFTLGPKKPFRSGIRAIALPTMPTVAPGGGIQSLSADPWSGGATSQDPSRSHPPTGDDDIKQTLSLRTSVASGSRQWGTTLNTANSTVQCARGSKERFLVTLICA